MTKILLTSAFMLLLTACASNPGKSGAPAITLPMLGGWFNGQKVYYITTDISDKGMAEMMGANYAPRLSDAILPRPRPAGVKSAVERVYVFPDRDQGSILPSSPTPLGYTSLDKNYSPIWQVYFVRWTTEDRKLLTSEEALLAAQDTGKVSIERTEIIVNCPIVKTESANLGAATTPSEKTEAAW